MIILDFFVSFLKRECGNVWEGDGGDNSENKKTENSKHVKQLIMTCVWFYFVPRE